MPGIHTIILSHPRRNLFRESDLNFLLHEENFKVKIITNLPNCLMAISFYSGYPFIEWRDNDIQIVLEGMIYNYPMAEIKKQLNEIAKNFIKNLEYKNLIKKFVEKADGDYIVQIWESNSSKLLVFNDYLGRLPIYYYFQNDLFVLSREIKTILEFIPQIILDKPGLVEYLMLEYPLGNKTIFKNICRLCPAQMIIVNGNNDKLNFAINNSTDFNFVLKNPFSDKKKSINYLREMFLESVKNRVNTLKDKGYEIISDLSGGYDTRAVLEGLRRYTKNVYYFTFEYIRDESNCARLLFEKIGAPGVYQKLSFDNKFSLEDENISQFLYKTDGLVNYHTMAVCYKDLEFLKKNFLRKPTARFCGLGGEFIRHPCKNYYRSLFYGFEKGLYSRLSIDVACKIVNQNINKYKEMLKNYFDSYPEKMPEDQLKRFYYEYYNHYVDWGGEERGRLYFWTVEPLWGLNFVRSIFNQLPLSWTGYRYYVQFLKSLNPLLLKVPIYDSRINLESMFGLYFYDFFEKLKKSNFAIIFRRKIQSRIPSLMIPYYKRKYRKTTVRRFDRNYLFKKSQYYYEALKHTKNIFNFNIIKRKLFKPDDDTERVLTLMIYFKEIEKRFGNKFSNSN